jgi:dihydroorotate dehydrogenase
MYNPLFRKLLFSLSPELAHSVTLKGLRCANYFNIVKDFTPTISAPCTVMGLKFLNPVGLAAGLDKNGDYIAALAALGFGFIEVGTITRKPQVGNPKPRLFRLEKQQALINRMGFNNKGIEHLIKRLKKTKYKGVLGINIGKNKDTPIETAVEDYLYLYKRVAPYASYVTINISSPNTENLRDLQHGELLQTLLRTLKKQQMTILEVEKKYVPLVVKIAPDLVQPELEMIADIFLTEKVDGVIATNTTLNRENIPDALLASEVGGLSGKPLRERSTEIIRHMTILLKNRIPIIGCGGIFSAEDAQEKINAGAKLVQLYTGLIYQGPGLIEDCVKKFKEKNKFSNHCVI